VGLRSEPVRSIQAHPEDFR